MGTGGCTAYDVVHILRKARAPVTDCVVEIDADRAAADPKVFTRIHFHFIVTGKRTQGAAGRARDPPLGGKVLLGINHARQDRGDHARLRDQGRIKPITAKAQRREGTQSILWNSLLTRALCASAPLRWNLKPIGSARHDPRGELHRKPRGLGQVGAAMAERARGMLRLVVFHLFEYRAALPVFDGQLRKMALQVRDDLALGLGEKAQVPAIAQQPRGAPMANEPAYHSGFNRLFLPPSSSMRRSVQARCSVSSCAACSSACLAPEARAVSACPWYSAWAQISPL
jgi:hypothetical protein